MASTAVQLVRRGVLLAFAAATLVWTGRQSTLGWPTSSLLGDRSDSPPPFYALYFLHLHQSFYAASRGVNRDSFEPDRRRRRARRHDRPEARRVCDAGSSCGLCLVLVDPSECPGEPKSLLACNAPSLRSGDMCESNATCGTDYTAHNCRGGYSVYFIVPEVVEYPVEVLGASR